MKLFLACGSQYSDAEILIKNECKFLLFSYYEFRNRKEQEIHYILRNTDEVIVDSGAFTFMNSGKVVKWKNYVDEYIDFIKRYNIKNFIELDLYGILGLEKTEKIRRRIETKTEKQSIPVYHGTLPISYFRTLCQNYPYVAVSATGTIESSKWTKNKQVLRQVIKIGHGYGTKIHGLGYTKSDCINKKEVNFDTVDSTAWLSGARFGIWYDLKHGMICQKNMKGLTKMLYNEHNSKVWIEKQKQLYEGE